MNFLVIIFYNNTVRKEVSYYGIYGKESINV